MAWCDFVVCAHDDIFVQLIYQDSTVLSSLKVRCDFFLFNTYMSKYLSMKSNWIDTWIIVLLYNHFKIYFVWFPIV